jgi:(p)ppGpp synthase/HD superfamily hydrolase
MDRDKLRDWVREKHAGQLIRRSGKPYFDHVLAVAEMAAPYTPFGYEVGLCHDLIENPPVTPEQLLAALIQFGYTISDADEIVKEVIELTDVFSKANFPLLNKEDRKSKEAERLASISPGAQTVKYADLLYNLHWMLTYDRSNLFTYIHTKVALLKEMDKGNLVLWKKAIAAFESHA